MLQYLGSYIWGEEDEPEVHEYHHDEVEVEGEWMYIPKDNENSKCLREDEDVDRTFNLAECNLFCVSDDEENMECGNSAVEERLQEIAKQEEAKTVGSKRMLSKRVPLKDLNAKIAIIRKKDSPKNMKRSNNVQSRVNGTRKNKQFGRMQGKHSGMVAPRAQRK